MKAFTSQCSVVSKNAFGVMLCAFLFAFCIPADAQQSSKLVRIGYLTPSGSAPSQAFLLGLRELGYVEGQNISIEYRSGEGNRDRLPELAAELVRLQVDIIVADGAGANDEQRKLPAPFLL